jgi:YgiT-type zinc finger domain-containing protein
MTKDSREDICPTCGGLKEPGRTTFTSELGFGVVVIRNVPATVCTQCGADWISDETAAEIERLIDDARRKRSQVEVVALS